MKFHCAIYVSDQCHVDIANYGPVLTGPLFRQWTGQMRTCADSPTTCSLFLPVTFSVR